MNQNDVDLINQTEGRTDEITVLSRSFRLLLDTTQITFATFGVSNRTAHPTFNERVAVFWSYILKTR
jgi:hypothetical protein